MDVISVYETLLECPHLLDFFVSNFVVTANLYNAVFVSYVTVGNFEKALAVIQDAELIYEYCKSMYRDCLKLRQNTNSIEGELQLKTIISFFQEDFRLFNQFERFSLYSNIAYAYYKNKKYEQSLFYYERILSLSKKLNNMPANFKIQLMLWRSQVLYYSCQKHSKKSLDKLFINEIKSYIEIIQKFEQNYDTVMALGKLNYFIGNFNLALNYIEYALDIVTKKGQIKKKSFDKSINVEDKYIFAYDWLSRITYKQKKYDAAASFYEKLIEHLIRRQNKYLYKSHAEIHPIPQLSDMVRYLNETKEKIAQRDIYYVNKSIRAAIIIAALYGAIDIYRIFVEKIEPITAIGVTFIITLIVIILCCFCTR